MILLCFVLFWLDYSYWRHYGAGSLSPLSPCLAHSGGGPPHLVLRITMDLEVSIMVHSLAYVALGHFPWCLNYLSIYFKVVSLAQGLLTGKCHHFDEISITACIRCRNDNCSYCIYHWLKCCQNDDITVSVVWLPYNTSEITLKDVDKITQH